MNNAYTYQRVVSYIIDIIIIGIFVALITSWIPNSEKYNNAIKEQEKYSELYNNKEIDVNKYIDKIYEMRYVLEKETIIESLIMLVITFAYFASFAYYNNGQTLGKKVMHIKIVSEDEKEATHLQLCLRALIINECFISMLSIIMLLFISSDQYIYTVGAIQIIQSLIIIVSLLMIIIRKDKRGMHDILCKTKVVNA